MEGIHGYPGSHWPPPPGEYSCHDIAPAAAGLTSKQNNNLKCTIITSRFDSRADVPVRYHALHPMEGVQGFDGSHWSPPLGKYCDRCMKSVTHMALFLIFSLSTH
jgi:hypothetical protein